MEAEIIVALLGLIGTLAGSFLGVLAASKMTNYRLQQLEERVNKHNGIIERTYRLEEHAAVLDVQLDAAELRINALEKKVGDPHG